MTTKFKFLALLFSIFSLFQQVTAQDYEAIKTDSSYSFLTEGYKYFKAYNIHSSVSANDGFVQLNDFHECSFNYSPYCVKPKDYSWLGQIFQKGTVYYFLNSEQDTFIIRTDTKVDDVWTFGPYGNNGYLELLHEATRAEVFWGRTDSVKIFSIVVRNESDEIIEVDYLSGEEIHLSQSFGLSRILNLRDVGFNYEFCSLVGKGNVGLRNIGYSEVYDYEVGDEFHIREIDLGFGTGTVKEEILTVVSKTWGNTEETKVEYEQERIQRTEFRTEGNLDSLTYVFDTVALAYDFNDYPTNILPNKTANTSIFFGGCAYYSISFDDRYGTLQKLEIMGHGFNIDSSNLPIDSCFEEVITTLNTTYFNLEGLGYFWVLQSGFNGPYAKSKLPVYYKKGSEEWGNPFDRAVLLSNEKKTLLNKSSVYPNPAKSIIRIVSIAEHDLIAKIEVFDLQGSVVLSQKSEPRKQWELSVSQFTEGLYFIKIYNSKDELIAIDKFTKSQ